MNLQKGESAVDKDDIAELRRALVRRRLAAGGLGRGPGQDPKDPRPSGAAAPDGGLAPLSDGQRHMWLAQRLDATGAAYNVCLAVTLSGPLDVPALRHALRALVVRHDVLRTRYVTGADEFPRQIADPPPAPADLPLPVTDLRDAEDGAFDAALARLAGHRFDLARDWPVRTALWRTGDDEHVLGLVVHHIAWDGGSWPVIAAELGAGYTAAVEGRAGEPVAAIEPRYAEITAGAGESRAARDDLDHWERRLAGLPGPLRLPADRPGGQGGLRRSVVLPAAETAVLTEFAARRRVTPFTLLLAAMGVLLHRHGAGTDLPIGSAGMNRDTGAAQALVGNFGNTLVLRLDVAGDPSFETLLRRADAVRAEAFTHQDAPYDTVAARLRRAGGDAARHGGDLFNVMLLFLTQDMTGPRLPGLRTRWRNVHNGTAQFDLSFEAFLVDGELEIEATCHAALFSKERLDALLGDLRGLLRAAVAAPDAPVSALPVSVLPVPVGAPAEHAEHTEHTEQGDGAARTPAEVEALVRDTMAELLEQPAGSVARDGDFFALGGNSLLATRMVAALRAALGTDVSLRDVVGLRTPAALAAAVAPRESAGDWRSVTGGDREEGPGPLTAGQRALWFLRASTGPSAEYNVALGRRLRGPLDVAALRAALADVLERHEVLRAVFGERDGTVVHRVLATGDALAGGAGLRVRRAAGGDAATGPAEDAFENLDAAVEAELGHVFRLEDEPALRVTLFEEGEGAYVLLFVLHHLVFDEWSESVLCSDLARAYRARAAGEAPRFAALPARYADFARWQRRVLAEPEGEMARQRAFWRGALHDLPDQIPLPADRPRPAEPDPAGEAVSVPVPRAVVTALRALAVRRSVPPFAVWHALVALLLSRNGGGSDVPLGTPVSGRGTGELGGLIGMFTNTVVLRSDLSGHPAFAELVDRLAEADLAAFDHQDLPFERVVELVDPPRVLGRNPLFQTMLMYVDAAPDALRLPGVADEPLPARLDVAKFDLSFTVVDDEGPAGPHAVVRYSTALFERATAERLGRELRQLAEEAAADPDRSVARVEHLPEADRRLLVEEFNATAAPVSRASLADLFAAQAAATPDAIAVACGKDEVTYADLDARARRLAAELVARGVGPEKVVGVHLDRSVELVVALLAALRAGGAFVPLEPAWPRQRIAEVVRTSAPTVVVTREPAEFAGSGAAAVEPPDAAGGADGGDPADAPGLPRLGPDSLAYIMYTSGSTGTPKGAMIRHGAIANRLLWQRGLLDFGPGDAALFKAPLGFDISVNEIFLPLVTGATLVVCPPGDEHDAEALARLVATRRVTFCYLTSSLLDVMLGTEHAAGLACLRHVWCGGEVLTPELFARFRAALDATLYHGYGPAEATIGVSHEVYGPGHERGAVTIGHANPNTVIHLLDAQLRPVSLGVPGEIYLGGLPLARGYVDDPGRTAERFVADPFSADGARLYRTGDLGRRRPDGTLEFLGRIDNQVKIRGMRVEPEEVEAALSGHPAVRSAAVVARSDGGTKRLAAYHVAAEGAELSEEALRGWLGERLPAHMVPASFTALTAMPLLPSGKVDRARLPAPVRRGTVSRPPRDAREALLCELVAGLLGVAEVGAEDDFFRLGGDSILSIQLVSAARAAGLRLAVRDVFAAPTVAGLAARAAAAADGARGEEAADGAPWPGGGEGGGDALPLAPLQQGLLFHALSSEGADAYVAQLTLRLGGALDEEALRAAVDGLARRHESLRASFGHDENGVPVQRFAAEVRVPWRAADLGGLGAAERELRWAELVETERATPFDPARAPLLRAVLGRFGDGEHRLLLTNHHLLFDGWSLPLLVRDLLAGYAGDALAPPPGQYRAHLRWLAGRDTEAAAEAWRAALDGLPGPTRLVDEATDTGHRAAAEHSLALGAGLTGRLTALARERGVTVGTLLSAAWGTVLGLLTGESDAVFGVTVSGRPPELPGAEGTVGLFINTVPVRVRAEPGLSFGELLRRLHAEQGALMDHQHLGLAEIQRQAGGGELFDTLLVFENYPADRAELAATAGRGGLDLLGIDSSDDTHYPLTLLVQPGDELTVRLRYRGAALGRERVEAIGERLRAVLARLAERPDAPLGALDPLLPGEPRGAASQTPAHPGDVVEAIDRAAAASPDATAVTADGVAYDYAWLAARSRRIARLLTAHGAGPERLVGIALHRSADLIAAVPAVLRTGAAFLPLDPGQPPARLARVLGQARPVAVLTTRALAGTLPADDCGTLLVLDDIDDIDDTDDADGLAQDGPEGREPVPVRAGQPAYAVFTSGSTGEPKGAVLTRQGLYNRLVWTARAHGIGPEDVVLHKTPISFDVAVWELLLPLAVGARVVVAEPGGHQDPGYLAGLIRAEGVTTAHFVPSMLRAYLDDARPAGSPPLRRLLCSGEALPADLAARAAALGVEVHNLYGPTEATIDVTAARHGADRDAASGPTVPIGRPVDGTRVHVLDRALRPVPPGVPGELYLGGVQLARGYLGRPGLTAAHFVADPFSGGGARLYRTGDIVRTGPDGSLEYLGRGDDQVKIRGVRVEPAEAEAALAALPGIAAAAVVPRAEGSGGTRLVGYAVPEAGAVPPDPEALREALAGVLPEQLVPTWIVVLDTLPLTSSGKVDRRALPAPERPAADGGRAPDGERETVLCGLFAEVLDLPSVGPDDNFFALGGDSISSLRLVTLARAAGLRCSPRQVFEAPTPAGLSRLAEESAPDPVRRAAEVPAHGPVPLTPIMRRLLDRGGPVKGFAQSVVVRTPAGARADWLTAALDAVVRTHDMLRARLESAAARPADDGGTSAPRLLVEPPGDGPGEPPRRVEGVPEPEALAETVRREAELLDPAGGRMLRAVWWDAGPGGQGRLLLVAHHLVVDGVSWRVLLTDLAAAYEAAAAGRPVRLAPVGTSFRAWALAAADAASADAEGRAAAWRDRLAGPPPRLADRPLSPERDVLAATRRTVTELPAALTREVLRVAGSTALDGADAGGRADAQRVLLAALVAALAGTGAEPAPLVRLEGHGREEQVVPGSDLTRTVGWFTTAFPVRLDASGLDLAEVAAGGPDAGLLLARVGRAVAGLPDHGLEYGLLRYAGGASTAVLAALPEPLVGFNYLGRFGGGAEDWSLDSAAGPLGGAGDPAMPVAHVLDVNAAVDGTGDEPRLRVSWTYLPELLPAADVDRLAARWAEAVGGLLAHLRDAPEAAAEAAAEGAAPALPEPRRPNLVALSGGQLDRLRRRFAPPGAPAGGTDTSSATSDRNTLHD
ncbi:amino acid adenylation domain-containing protein [Streptomyces sp. NPDC047002]|uniref:amino acid adenylation domain-containing protein n=1 Tax=Streptomyces sp. NPDC047002 TaxID=3155475 RepID=UPI0034552D3F